MEGLVHIFKTLFENNVYNSIGRLLCTIFEINLKIS